ncbi:type II toxin-antitoxin system RelE/ParE family toxin [bacterium]|nr:type II toxin-antitoxin system RelE/ParE family toxin [bacterium]
MEILEKQIIYYTTTDGKCPYLNWLNTLDSKTQDIVNARIDRLKDGLKGDWKRLTNSKLSELRIDYGKGYRVYYRELNNIIILVVAGGDKSDQKRLINQAGKYLKELEERI